jgi:hypothetical protein
MFSDINGNTFSTLGNNNVLPTMDYNPQQIYGNNLLLWVDFTDKTTLFTDTGLTTNVVNNGDYIRGIRDKSLRRTSLRLSNPISASTDYQYTSLTQYNTKSGIIRSAAQTLTYNGGFLHSASNFLSANANYSVHLVCRLQGNNATAGIYTQAFINNTLFINGTNISIQNGAAGFTNILTTNPLTSHYILSVSLDFGIDTYETFNNNRYQPIISSTTAMNYAGNLPITLFTRFGTAPSFASVVQGFYCQEIFFVSGTSTTQQLNFAHQYLRLKYL